MDAAAFLVEVRRRAGAAAEVRDPLEVATKILRSPTETAEVQILRRAVDAIGLSRGEFSEADIYLLSRELLKVVSALVEAKLNEQYPGLAWAEVTTRMEPLLDNAN